MRLLTTHVSWLVAAGTRVYKLKRPVHFPFIDLTSVEARRRACELEVTLNSRLSPDVYEGVGSVVRPDGTTEPMVVMRLLPADRRLSTLLATDDPAAARCIDELADLIGRFHAGLPRTDVVSAHGTADAVTARWASNLAELRSVAGGIIDASLLDGLDAAGQRFLSGRRALLDARAYGGHIVEGHGDLLADDVFCLDDGPRVLDCLEFDFDLRCIDTACEIASLAADVERLLKPDMAERFAERYQAGSGERWPTSLFAFYCAYRALVRAKVACLRAVDGDDDARVEAADLAILARRKLAADSVRLVLVGGLPGSGKSTTARLLGDATGWPVLRSDEIRRAASVVSSGEQSFGAGLYEAERVAAVYVELLERAGTAMRMGDSVVVDASWNRECWRRAARTLARDCAADIVELRCDAPVDVALSRIDARLRAGDDVSQATPEVALRMAQLTEPWPQAHSIDTQKTPFEAASAALRIVRSAGGN